MRTLARTWQRTGEKNMAVRLILTDIDGTILPWGRHEVSARTRSAFHAALDAGIVVGPASGRFYPWVPAFFGGDEACCATAIAANGLQVYHGGRQVMARSIEPGPLHRAAEVLRDEPRAGLLYFEGDVPLLALGSRDDLAEAFPRYARECLDAPGLPDAPVPKANVFVNGTLEETRELVARLNAEVDGLDFDVPQAGFSNVMPAGWNKGAALAWLQDHLGVTREETVVFGDAGNDLALFAQAAHPVAVAGALPEAAAAARWHIGACEDDAVAAAIEALAAGDWPFER